MSATGQALAKAVLPTGYCPYLAVFSPDGRTAAVAHDGGRIKNRAVRRWRMPKDVK